MLATVTSFVDARRPARARRAARRTTSRRSPAIAPDCRRRRRATTTRSRRSSATCATVAPTACSWYAAGAATSPCSRAEATARSSLSTTASAAGADPLPRRRVAARERRDRRSRQRRVRPRARRRRPDAGRVRRRRARLRRAPAASRAIPDRWKVALVLLGARRDRVRMVARPPPRSARRPDARPAARAVADTSTRWSITLERTHDPAPRSRRCNSGRATGSSVGAGLATRRGRDAVDRGRATAWVSTDAEIAALWHPPVDDDEVLALGRVVDRAATDERT